MHEKMYLVLIIALVVSMLLTGCQEQQQVQEFEGIPVTTSRVELHSISSQESFYGEIISREAVSISSTLPGRITKAPAKNGEQVQRGQLLFQLENTDLQSAVAQAHSSIEVATANLNKLQSGPDELEIAAMQENVQAAKERYELATQEAERFQALFESGAISQQQQEQVQTERKIAQANYQALQHQLEQMQAGPAQEVLEVGMAQVQQSQVNYQAAFTKIKELSIASPLAGLIANIQVKEGEFINPGMPLATVHDLTQVYVQLYIPEAIFIELTEGKQVEVSISTLQETYQGQITELNPQADLRTNLFSVKVAVDNPDLRLKPGMAAKVTVPFQRKEQALTVPTNSILNEKGESIIFVLEEKVARKRTIETGIRTAESTEVLTGLQLGEQIIVDGIEFIRDGDKVKILQKGSD